MVEIRENSNVEFHIPASFLSEIDDTIGFLNQRYPEIEKLNRTMFCRLCLAYVLDHMEVFRADMQRV
jgi:hypothetical protein